MEKKIIEMQIGTAIIDVEFEKAAFRAKQKLQSIIQLYGDHNGDRRSPEYLAELTIEAVLQELFQSIR